MKYEGIIVDKQARSIIQLASRLKAEQHNIGTSIGNSDLLKVHILSVSNDI